MLDADWGRIYLHVALREMAALLVVPEAKSGAVSEHVKRFWSARAISTSASSPTGPTERTSALSEVGQEGGASWGMHATERTCCTEEAVWERSGLERSSAAMLELSGR